MIDCLGLQSWIIWTSSLEVLLARWPKTKPRDAKRALSMSSTVARFCCGGPHQKHLASKYQMDEKVERIQSIRAFHDMSP
mmetsp:Transcript_90631/g.180261  ORF Transcript_90631/g.180261 Transcript_90631/m.180261 type:complete len:80 (-) Transcript_90631:617-856(-)